MKDVNDGGQPALNSAEQVSVRGLLSKDLWEEALNTLITHVDYPVLVQWVLQKIAAGPGVEGEAQACIHTMRRWLANRDDDALRRQIFEQANALGFDTPPGLLGLSIFWSQGSMTAPNLDPVYPEPHLCSLMLFCSLKLLCLAQAKDLPPQENARQLVQPWLTSEVL